MRVLVEPVVNLAKAHEGTGLNDLGGLAHGFPRIMGWSLASLLDGHRQRPVILALKLFEIGVAIVPDLRTGEPGLTALDAVVDCAVSTKQQSDRTIAAKRLRIRRGRGIGKHWGCPGTWTKSKQDEGEETLHGTGT